MEIILGILLVFGVFTLGNLTSGSAGHETHTVQGKSVSEEHPAGQGIDAVPFPPCPAQGSTIPYRDLTVPVLPPAPQPAAEDSDDAAEFSWDE